MEGSPLSERDLVRTRAHTGSAILLLADRFSRSSHQEDLGLQFQVPMAALSAPVCSSVSALAQKQCADAAFGECNPAQCLPLAPPEIVG